MKDNLKSTAAAKTLQADTPSSHSITAVEEGTAQEKGAPSASSDGTEPATKE